MFQETVKGKNCLQFAELQNHFRDTSDASSIEYELGLLQKEYLVEKVSGSNGGHDYRLTRAGIARGYNIYEYDLQLNINDIFVSYEPLGHLGIGERSSILDICCGAGQTLVAICKHITPLLAVGFDIEVGNLLFARQQASVYLGNPSPCLWLAANARDLPFRKNSFTHIIFRQALYLVDAEKAMAEMTRVLCSQGTVYIRVPSYRHAFGYFKRQGIRNIARGLFVVLNGIAFHFFFKQFKIYLKSKSMLYCEMFYTKRAIKNLCTKYGLDVQFVQTPKGKGGLMILAKKTIV
jgi:ubiquinone/menaquinone biosynthesis C-methylase UbiE